MGKEKQLFSTNVSTHLNSYDRKNEDVPQMLNKQCFGYMSVMADTRVSGCQTANKAVWTCYGDILLKYNVEGEFWPQQEDFLLNEFDTKAGSLCFILGSKTLQQKIKIITNPTRFPLIYGALY